MIIMLCQAFFEQYWVMQVVTNQQIELLDRFGKSRLHCCHLLLFYFFDV